MVNIFNTILVHPLLNLLVFFYNYIPDIGIVIILITVLVRLVMLPSFHKSLKHQRALQALQPKMQEIKEKFKDDKQRQAMATMELYKAHKINPLSSCLPLLIQIPILFALYRVFIQSLNGETLQGLYSFVPHPESINPIFLSAIDLSATGNYWLAAVAAVLQYFQTKSFQKSGLGSTKTGSAVAGGMDSTMKMMNNYILYFLPALTFFIGVQFPAGLALYWIATTLFGIGQQYYILRKEAKEALYGKQQ